LMEDSGTVLRNVCFEPRPDVSPHSAID
jgi:hypothetical protein